MVNVNPPVFRHQERLLQQAKDNSFGIMILNVERVGEYVPDGGIGYFSGCQGLS